MKTYESLSVKEKTELLKRFLDEFFDYKELKKVGLFDKSILKNDYQKQADRICQYFGLNTIYEYGATEISAHISYASPTDNPFVEKFLGIYK